MVRHTEFLIHLYLSHLAWPPLCPPFFSLPFAVVFFAHSLPKELLLPKSKKASKHAGSQRISTTGRYMHEWT